MMVLTLVVTFMGIFWQRGESSQPRKRSKLIELSEYKFPSLVLAVFTRENPNLSSDQRDLAFAALKEYFMVILLEREAGRRDSLGMPSTLADDAWHAFVLCTKDYAEFCERFFGRMIHHYPDPAARPEILTRDTYLKDEVIRTWQASREHSANHRGYFNPLGPNEAPMLFALDAYAGIKDGWQWSPSALAALEQRKDVRDTSTSGSSCSLDDGFAGAGFMASGCGATASSSACGSSGSSDTGSSCGSSCSGGGGGCGGGGD